MFRPTDSFDTDRECPICFEPYEAPPSERTPVNLACGHTMCRADAANLAKAQCELKCPICMQCMPLQEGGIAALPCNYALVHMIEAIAKEDDGSDGNVGGGGKDGGDHGANGGGRGGGSGGSESGGAAAATRPSLARQAGGGGVADCIDLCLSSSDEDEAAVAKTPGKGKGKRAVPLHASGDTSDDDVVTDVTDEWLQHMAKRAKAGHGAHDEDEDEVYALPPPVAMMVQTGGDSGGGASAAAAGADDDEIEEMGHTGSNALADFPHSRSNCVVHAFKAGHFAEHCTNCFCYVCDKPAADCGAWASHCAAHHDDAKWRAERARARARLLKQQQQQLAPGAVAAASSSSGASSSAAAAAASASSSSSYNIGASAAAVGGSGGGGGAVGPMTCEALMKAIEQVWPVEAPAPPKLVVGALRPYQKQSLAFMLQLERAPDGAETVGRTPPYMHGGAVPRGGWLASEVGMGKTVVTIALILANPMSLAKSAAAGSAGGAGGGIAKSHWSCALCTFRNAPSADSCEICKTSRSGVAPQNPAPPAEKASTCWKTTLIVVPNTIVGQWYDELRKYAPSVDVAVWHSGFSRQHGGARHLSVHELAQLDVILTTPGCVKGLLSGRRSKMWRIVVDGTRSASRPAPFPTTN